MYLKFFLLNLAIVSATSGMQKCHPSLIDAINDVKEQMHVFEMVGIQREILEFAFPCIYDITTTTKDIVHKPVHTSTAHNMLARGGEQYQAIKQLLDTLEDDCFEGEISDARLLAILQQIHNITAERLTFT